MHFEKSNIASCQLLGSLRDRTAKTSHRHTRPLPETSSWKPVCILFHQDVLADLSDYSRECFLAQCGIEKLLYNAISEKIWTDGLKAERTGSCMHQIKHSNPRIFILLLHFFSKDEINVCDCG